MILKKLGDEYKLYSHDSCIATTHESPYKKLSLKNCQAIENGYDLDELAENNYPTFNLPLTDTTAINTLKQDSFKEGFQKAIELLSDKKFSEKELTMMFAYGHQIGMNTILAIQSQHSPQPMPKPDSDKLRDELIQSLQQTEWDVEIEMENKQQLTNGYKNQPDNVIGFIAAYENVVVPKLDADGCLILKRK